eukprot:gene30526-36892_t
MLKNNTCIREGVEQKRVHMSWVDIGSILAFGYPASESHKHEWPVYSESIKNLGFKTDFVLVDGRFRVASALKSLFFTNPKKSFVAIHDFFDRRAYHSVLNYADIVDCQDSLVILRLQPNVDRKSLEQEIKSYAH